MSRKDAHAFAASLAATLMVSIVVFQAGDGTFGAVPADEIELPVPLVNLIHPFAERGCCSPPKRNTALFAALPLEMYG